MAGMIDQLAEIMEEQAQKYGELLGLSEEKKEAIIKNDISTLQKLTNLENMVISQNNRLEKKRLSLGKDIAEVLGKKEDELDLNTLISLLPDQTDKDMLKNVGDRIREVVSNLKLANEQNNNLIQNALDYIEYSVNVMRSAANPERSKVPIVNGNISDASGSFDTKS